MCRSESAWQSNSACLCSRQGEEAHIYNQITYFLCHDSRDGRPCQNVVPSTEDVFSSTPLPGFCPVCQAIERATATYNAVEAQAREGPPELFEATLQHASRQKKKEMDDIYSVVRIVRPKRGANLAIIEPQKKRLMSAGESVKDGQNFDDQNEASLRDPYADDRHSQSMKNTYITRKSVIDDPTALHPVYHVIAKPRRYFKPGRVFSVVWTEPADPSRSTLGSKNLTPVAFDQYAWTEIRRFIVARDMSDHCLALPIHTFGGRGAQKNTVRPKDQRPVFSIPENWDRSTPSEEHIPIKVEDPDIDFKNGLSFVLFSKHYSIEHYLPVRNIGYVVKETLPILESCFLAALGVSDIVQTMGSSTTPYSTQALMGQIKSMAAEALASSDGQMAVACDYDTCYKTFNREDSYRDHLRDFHKEDILSSRRTDHWWFDTRNLQEDWWRCKSCLSRVLVSQYAYRCWSCAQPCEDERVTARKTRLTTIEPRISAAGQSLHPVKADWGNDFQESGLQAGKSIVKQDPASRFSTTVRMKYRSSGKKARKRSGTKSHRAFLHPPESGAEDNNVEAEPEIEDTPPSSFLFQVNQLPIDNKSDVPPRTNNNGVWVPPIYERAFGRQSAGNFFRWNSNGRITLATDCSWDGRLLSRSGLEVTLYSTRTVFWCNAFAQFMVATGDASDRDMADSEFPHNVWWPINFEHSGAVSRVTESSTEQYLSGGLGPRWIEDLGLSSYILCDYDEDNNPTAPAEALSGNLAILFGIIAMSCSAESFETMLTRDRALRHHIWRGYDRQNGRSNQRGVVVHIYLDPDNPDGSTLDSISALEFEGPPIIQR